MPTLAKGSKKSKGKKGGAKKGTVKIVPDPDAGYKQQLDETFYLPKPSRVKLNKGYTAVIDAAIKANMASATSAPTTELSIPSQIPLVKIPEIVRSLGLFVSDSQIDQICCMVSQTSAPADRQPNTACGKENASQSDGTLVDTEKVRQVLSDILRTHVLAYDPQVLSCSDPRFPERVSSVVNTVSERDLVLCFESLWVATGRRSVVRNDGTTVRCLNVEDLEVVMAEAQKGIITMQPLSNRELDNFYFFVKGEGSDVIEEDAFVNCLANVK